MKFPIKSLTPLLAILILFTNYKIAGAKEMVTGAGSSFIAPVLYLWSNAYVAENGAKINYQSTGSGFGIKQIESKIVDFGATDMPLKIADLNSKGLFQFPAIIGGIVMVTNLSGIAPGELILNAKIIAEIYTGQIKNWNDKRIADLNPKLKLPNKNIIVVYRSDASGTTFNYTYYLEKASEGVWDSKRVGTLISWPSGILGVGGKGNGGVENMVNRSPGAIGYVEYDYAMKDKLSWSRLQNAEGNVVPQIEEKDLQNEKKVAEAFRNSFQGAALHADWDKSPGMYVLLANQKGALSWPITASTFILIQKNQLKPKVGSEVLKFFNYAFTKGSESAHSLNYIPIPENTYKLIQKKWASNIKSEKDSAPLWK